MSKTNTQILSEFLSSVKYEAIPQSALDQAKKMTLHTVGAAIASRGLDASRKPIELALEVGGREEATIWGSGSAKVSAQEAAFANGTLSDLLDWEDCSWTGHGSAGIIPAAMAMGEKKHISGKDYLTAVVTGFEGYHRAAMAVQPSQDYLLSGNGWGLVSWQVFASAVPTGKILGFDADHFNQLFGACQYNTVVPTNRHSEGNKKSDVYHFCHGFCARNGMAAAAVTEKGFSNLNNCFEGETSAYWQFVSDKLDYDWLVKNLGTEWYINSTYLKHWPANMWVQTALEALDHIMKRRPFTCDEVEKIRVSPVLGMICANYAQSSRTALDSQFSIGFCMTSYIMDKNHSSGAHWFTEDRLNNPELIEFADTKYEFFGPNVTTLDCFDDFRAGSFTEAQVEIYFKDGSVEKEANIYPKGHPLNNFTMDEECDHFRHCCGPYMDAENVESIISLVRELEKLEDINELAEKLSAVRKEYEV